MDCHVRAGLECQAALIQAEIDLLGVSIDEHELASQGKKRRRWRWWCRAWLSPERRRHFGLHDQLMTELRREDQKAFVNFLRISPEMFDEILERVGPRLTRQRTHYRDPLLVPCPLQMRFSSGVHVPEIFRDGLHRPRDDFWERISTDKYFLHIFCPFGIRSASVGTRSLV